MMLLCAVVRISEISLSTGDVSAAYTRGLGCIEEFEVMASYHSSSSGAMIMRRRDRSSGAGGGDDGEWDRCEGDLRRASVGNGEVVEASRREARVPRERDLVSALPTTPCVSSTSGSSPCCLLEVRLVLLGLGEAIFANNSPVECVCDE